MIMSKTMSIYSKIEVKKYISNNLYNKAMKSTPILFSCHKAVFFIKTIFR